MLLELDMQLQETCCDLCSQPMSLVRRPVCEVTKCQLDLKIRIVVLPDGAFCHAAQSSGLEYSSQKGRGSQAHLHLGSTEEKNLTARALRTTDLEVYGEKTNFQKVPGTVTRQAGVPAEGGSSWNFATPAFFMPLVLSQAISFEGTCRVMSAVHEKLKPRAWRDQVLD